ncbi:putative BURP domain-containing protein 3-like [Capsicum annuum]|nr:REF/SRPP-like protein At1g67360 [Capsicum annuum]KAF3642823.1 putative BURP domain-containing protein 3-like [Capsicum annuum]KAF3667245.1 putative BURP domain-containing protein 3-like [Capsicum annuum]
MFLLWPRGLFKDVQVAGPRAAICHAGKLSKILATSQVAVLCWYHVYICPPFHGIAQMAAPTAAHWSQKYNQLFGVLKKKSYSIVSYILLIPVEEISKACKQVETTATRKEGAISSSSNNSE